jgi:hypothetical protein
MSDLLLTLSHAPAVDPQPVTFDRWLEELLELTLELERSAACYWAIELSGTFYIWTCWAVARVN